MFGCNKDCPIRITSLVGYDKVAIELTVQALMDQFGWKIHSRTELHTVKNTVYSVLLFNLEGADFNDS